MTRRPDLDFIEARANAATQGPWEQNGYVVHASHGIGDVIADAGLTPADARFIAHARQDVPALISELRRLQDEQKRRQYVIPPETSEHPRTVGNLRAAIDGLPDDAQVFVNVSGHMEDYAIDEVWVSEQIPDGEPWPTNKRVLGLEIHLGLFPEPPEPPAVVEESEES